MLIRNSIQYSPAPGVILGLGGSRMRYHQTFTAGNKQMMCRSHQVAPCDISVFDSVWFAGFSTTSGLEAGPTAVSTDTMTFELALEYPAGVYYRVTFGGSNQGVCKLAMNSAGGGATLPENLLGSDSLTGFGTIPAGADYWWRFWTDSTAGIMYHNGHRDTAGGDLLNVGVTSPNLVMGGAITQNAGVSVCASPAAIIAQVTAASPGVVGGGDSIMFGQGHTVTSLTDMRVGIVGPSLAVNTPFLNLGLPGADFSNWYSRSINQRVFLQYARRWACNLGINNATTPAQMISDQQALLAYVPNAQKKVIVGLTPRSSGGVYTSTPGTQVAHGANATTYIPYNTLARAVPSGFTGFFETRQGGLEFAIDSGLWQNNAGVALTGDGLHPNTGGYDFLAAAGINAASLLN